MYKYEWDAETGGVLLLPEQEKMSKEARPVYYRELDLLGFDQYWIYPKDDSAPIMWAEANRYFYRGKLVAKVTGGGLFTKPQIDITFSEVPLKTAFQLININEMMKRNKELLQSLEHETIERIYDTYLKYKGKTDVIYVAFSGGKDSVVVADLVQMALPHDNFKIVFGDTDMELPTTKQLAYQMIKICEKQGIDFHIAKSHFRAEQSWKIFGPPSRRLRWCCSVHKSVPVLNKLNELLGYPSHLRSIMITGVRGYESDSRAAYSVLSIGKKIAGQISFHPILDWSSIEVFLYIFSKNLLLNEAYKFGSNRVGCLVCPNSSARQEYIKHAVYPALVDKFCHIIVNSSKKDLNNGRDKEFLETGGWKMRVTGRELKINDERIVWEERKNGMYFQTKRFNDTWKTWYKTIGKFSYDGNGVYHLEYDGIWRLMTVHQKDKSAEIFIENSRRSKNSIDFFYFFKNILNKVAYCVGCKLCEAECTYRNIRIKSCTNIAVSDECTRCKACLRILNGCIYYNSIKNSGGIKTMKGINRYLSVGVNGEWIQGFFKDQTFEPGNRKSDVMFGFLRDADILLKRKKTFTKFGEKIREIGLSDDKAWALMLCNLVYTPAFGWFITHVPFDTEYTFDFLSDDLGEDTPQKAKNEFWNGFKMILHTMPYGNSIGLAHPEIEARTLSNGSEQLKLKSLTRGHWLSPIPEVILYSLYKFAEACGGMKQFSLSTLLDDSIERDGISPTRIFGIDYDTMKRILNGLSVNYPDFISVTFSLDLEEITLMREKSALDVLDLL